MNHDVHHRSRDADRRCSDRRGFSLIELTIVVIIIGTITVIALPRLTTSSDGSDVTATLANLAHLNKALAMYAAEHRGPFPRAAQVENHLTRYTNAEGTQVRAVPDPANGIVFGPYLLTIPALTIGPNAGNAGIDNGPGAGIGWIYQVRRRRIVPNLRDDEGELPDELVNELNMTTDDFDDSNEEPTDGPVDTSG